MHGYDIHDALYKNCEINGPWVSGTGSMVGQYDIITIMKWTYLFHCWPLSHGSLKSTRFAWYYAIYVYFTSNWHHFYLVLSKKKLVTSYRKSKVLLKWLHHCFHHCTFQITLFSCLKKCFLHNCCFCCTVILCGGCNNTRNQAFLIALSSGQVYSIAGFVRTLVQK